MLWTILFLFLTTLIPTQPVARPPVQTSDLNQTGKQFNILGPGSRPGCRCGSQ